MLRIPINDYVSNLASQYANDIKVGFDAINRLQNLRKNLSRKRVYRRHVGYIDEIIQKYDSILVTKPSNFDTVLTTILTEAELGKSIPYGKSGKKEKFYKLLSKTLGYEWVRNHVLPKYMISLGIKSCVYCNAQYGVTIKRDKKSFTSSYEIDHFKPQRLYPHLSTSFFNLQPSCGHCNVSKGDKSAMFNLYTDIPSPLRPFAFNIQMDSVLKYLLSCDENHLEINVTSSDCALLNNHEERFKIKKKYECHRDEAAELVVKSRIYNKAYLNQLVTSFGAVLPQFHSTIKDIILGFPTDEKGIHRRPLSLMKQDIGKQLGLL